MRARRVRGLQRIMSAAFRLFARNGAAGMAQAGFRLGSGVSHRIGAQIIVRDKPRLDDVFCRL
jgi:hypothetical protein